MAPTTAVLVSKPSLAAKMGFSEDEVTLIKKTIAPGTTDEELALFLYTCKRTGLDPLARQIYAIKRSAGEEGDKKMTMQTSIDGYRLIADRTGHYAGSSEPIYDTTRATHPGWAKVTVYKLVGGEARPFTATVRWEEYVQQYKGAPSRMWKKMPYGMLGKCGEALALRKAFPQELSGLYTQDELPPGTTAYEGSLTVDTTTGEVVGEHERLPEESTVRDEVMDRLERSVYRFNHAGLNKEVLLQIFAAHPGNIREVAEEVLTQNLPTFRHLCATLDADGKPPFSGALTPTAWVADEIRKLAARTPEAVPDAAEEPSDADLGQPLPAYGPEHPDLMAEEEAGDRAHGLRGETV